MPTVLVTGARGLVGDAVLRHFLAHGWSAIVACSGPARGAVDGIGVVQFALKAVADNIQLRNALFGADVIIHCAAVLPSSGALNTPEGARALYIANSQGTYDLMDMASSAGVKCFVFISTCNLFSDKLDDIREDRLPSPSDAYMLSKLAGEFAGELMGRRSGTKFYCLRISAPYGARYSVDAVVPIFVRRALAGEMLEVAGTGAREQVFTYVEDIARACMVAVQSNVPGTYNIAGSQPTNMKELAQAAVRASGAFENLVTLTSKPDPNEAMRRLVSIDKARRVLNWVPEYDIDRGLADMVRQIRNPLPPLLVAA